MAVALLGPEGAEYRPLRDTAPWKYLGFGLAGTLLVTSLIAFVERRFRWQMLIVGLGSTVVLAMVYDLPFDDLLLLPNGNF